jgi:hypothetical protein
MMSVKKFAPQYFLGNFSSKFLAKFLGMSFLTLACFSSCSHQAIVPEAKNVRIAREEPSRNCKNLGHVEGSVITAHGKIEDAIEDMKLDAARKGANYVQMGQTSALGKNVAGVAFQCP